MNEEKRGFNEFKPGDRFYYFDIKTNTKTDKSGTVILQVFDGRIGSDHKGGPVVIQIYSVVFDDEPNDDRRLGNSQMIPDYRELRDGKLNELGI